MMHAIGIGPGDPGYMTRRGAELLAQAEVVAGFGAVLRLAEPLLPLSAEQVLLRYSDQEQRLAELAAAHAAGRRCVTLFMGDIGFSGFQLLERLERACGERVAYVPGISAAQMAAADGRVCFDETVFVSFHRRGDLAPFKQRLRRALADGWHAIVIPHPWDFMPKAIARHLLAEGVPGEQPLVVWEDLTRAERRWEGRLADCPDGFSDMSIMLIRSLDPVASAI